VIQQQVKFGITFGIIGLLLLSYAPLVISAPPFQTKDASTRSIADLQPTPVGQKLPVSAQVKINGRTILLEVARTPQQQEIGLMYRTELAADRGMLFVFLPPRPVNFWMKNTLIPLDMIFVSNGVVKYIGENIPPCKIANCPGYGPEATTAIDSVIELRGGSAVQLKMKVGDRVKIDNYSAKRLK
jgi:uncharacterized protein